MLREKLTEPGKVSQFINDSTASEQSAAIHEPKMTKILLARVPQRPGKSIDKAKFSLDRCESQVMRLMQHSGFAGNCCWFYTMPWNLRILNLQPVRCRGRFFQN